jgi:hypothetical protein
VKCRVENSRKPPTGAWPVVAAIIHETIARAKSNERAGKNIAQKRENVYYRGAGWSP